MVSFDPSPLYELGNKWIETGDLLHERKAVMDGALTSFTWSGPASSMAVHQVWPTNVSPLIEQSAQAAWTVGYAINQYAAQVTQALHDYYKAKLVADMTLIAGLAVGAAVGAVAEALSQVLGKLVAAIAEGVGQLARAIRNITDFLGRAGGLNSIARFAGGGVYGAAQGGLTDVITSAMSGAMRGDGGLHLDKGSLGFDVGLGFFLGGAIGLNIDQYGFKAIGGNGSKNGGKGLPHAGPDVGGAPGGGAVPPALKTDVPQTARGGLDGVPDVAPGAGALFGSDFRLPGSGGSARTSPSSVSAHLDTGAPGTGGRGTQGVYGVDPAAAPHTASAGAVKGGGRVPSVTDHAANPLSGPSGSGRGGSVGRPVATDAVPRDAAGAASGRASGDHTGGGQQAKPSLADAGGGTPGRVNVAGSREIAQPHTAESPGVSRGGGDTGGPATVRAEHVGADASVSGRSSGTSVPSHAAGDASLSGRAGGDPSVPGGTGGGAGGNAAGHQVSSSRNGSGHEPGGTSGTAGPSSTPRDADGSTPTATGGDRTSVGAGQAQSDVGRSGTGAGGRAEGSTEQLSVAQPNQPQGQRGEGPGQTSAGSPQGHDTTSTTGRTAADGTGVQQNSHAADGAGDTGVTTGQESPVTHVTHESAATVHADGAGPATGSATRMSGAAQRGGQAAVHGDTVPGATRASGGSDRVPEGAARESGAVEHAVRTHDDAPAGQGGTHDHSVPATQGSAGTVHDAATAASAHPTDESSGRSAHTDTMVNNGSGGRGRALGGERPDARLAQGRESGDHGASVDRSSGHAGASDRSPRGGAGEVSADHGTNPDHGGAEQRPEGAPSRHGRSAEAEQPADTGRTNDTGSIAPASDRGHSTSADQRGSGHSRQADAAAGNRADRAGAGRGSAADREGPARADAQTRSGRAAVDRRNLEAAERLNEAKKTEAAAEGPGARTPEEHADGQTGGGKAAVPGAADGHEPGALTAHESRTRTDSDSGRAAEARRAHERAEHMTGNSAAPGSRTARDGATSQEPGGGSAGPDRASAGRGRSAEENARAERHADRAETRRGVPAGDRSIADDRVVGAGGAERSGARADRPATESPSRSQLAEAAEGRRQVVGAEGEAGTAARSTTLRVGETEHAGAGAAGTGRDAEAGAPASTHRQLTDEEKARTGASASAAESRRAGRAAEAGAETARGQWSDSAERDSSAGQGERRFDDGPGQDLYPRREGRGYDYPATPHNAGAIASREVFAGRGERLDGKPVEGASAGEGVAGAGERSVAGGFEGSGRRLGDGKPVEGASAGDGVVGSGERSVAGGFEGSGRRLGDGKPVEGASAGDGVVGSGERSVAGGFEGPGRRLGDGKPVEGTPAGGVEGTAGRAGSGGGDRPADGVQSRGRGAGGGTRSRGPVQRHGPGDTGPAGPEAIGNSRADGDARSGRQDAAENSTRDGVRGPQSAGRSVRRTGDGPSGPGAAGGSGRALSAEHAAESEHAVGGEHAGVPGHTEASERGSGAEHNGRSGSSDSGSTSPVIPRKTGRGYGRPATIHDAPWAERRGGEDVAHGERDSAGRPAEPGDTGAGHGASGSAGHGGGVTENRGNGSATGVTVEKAAPRTELPKQTSRPGEAEAEQTRQPPDRSSTGTAEPDDPTSAVTRTDATASTDAAAVDSAQQGGRTEETSLAGTGEDTAAQAPPEPGSSGATVEPEHVTTSRASADADRGEDAGIAPHAWHPDTPTVSRPEAGTDSQDGGDRTVRLGSDASATGLSAGSASVHATSPAATVAEEAGAGTGVPDDGSGPDLLAPGSQRVPYDRLDPLAAGLALHAPSVSDAGRAQARADAALTLTMRAHAVRPLVFPRTVVREAVPDIPPPGVRPHREAPLSTPGDAHRRAVHLIAAEIVRHGRTAGQELAAQLLPGGQATGAGAGAVALTGAMHRTETDRLVLDGHDVPLQHVRDWLTAHTDWDGHQPVVLPLAGAGSPGTADVPPLAARLAAHLGVPVLAPGADLRLAPGSRLETRETGGWTEYAPGVSARTWQPDLERTLFLRAREYAGTHPSASAGLPATVQDERMDPTAAKAVLEGTALSGASREQAVTDALVLLAVRAHQLDPLADPYGLAPLVPGARQPEDTHTFRSAYHHALRLVAADVVRGGVPAARQLTRKLLPGQRGDRGRRVMALAGALTDPRSGGLLLHGEAVPLAGVGDWLSRNMGWNGQEPVVLPLAGAADFTPDGAPPLAERLAAHLGASVLAPAVDLTAHPSGMLHTSRAGGWTEFAPGTDPRVWEFALDQTLFSRAHAVAAGEWPHDGGARRYGKSSAARQDVARRQFEEAAQAAVSRESASVRRLLDRVRTTHPQRVPEGTIAGAMAWFTEQVEPFIALLRIRLYALDHAAEPSEVALEELDALLESLLGRLSVLLDDGATDGPLKEGQDGVQQVLHELTVDVGQFIAAAPVGSAVSSLDEVADAGRVSAGAVAEVAGLLERSDKDTVVIATGVDSNLLAVMALFVKVVNQLGHSLYINYGQDGPPLHICPTEQDQCG